MTSASGFATARASKVAHKIGPLEMLGGTHATLFGGFDASKNRLQGWSAAAGGFCMSPNQRLFRILGAGICTLIALVLSAGQAQDVLGSTNTQESHGIAAANMDLSVKPGDDFYRYANGGWMARTEIPSDRGAVGVFNMLADLSSKRTDDLIEEAAKSSAPAGSDTAKIAALFNSFMDESAIEAAGVAPLRPHLEAIAAIHDQLELARALGETLRADVDALNFTNFHTANLFGLWVAPGFGDSDHYTAYLLQGGLEMPDREYYLADNDRMRDIRAKYQSHISRMMKLAGFADTDARAQRVFDLEHAIAEKHISLADNEDIHKANNTWKRADFTSKAPGLDWQEYLRGAGLDKQASFIVWQPAAFAGESALVASTPIEAWKDWLAFHLIEDYAAALPKAFSDERFAFFGTVLSGTPEQRPRWQRGVALVNNLLGDAAGKIYAQRYFPPEAKAQAQAMVANIVAAFRKRIDALTWMDPKTKAEAQAKLTTLYVGIGYPDRWRGYAGYEVKKDDLFGNVWGGGLFDYRYEISRLGRSVDRKEWCMTPQTVNAVNMPLHNELNFPAAILQPPFFDPQAPAAANYGAIGAVIGHEISHTFDTEGSAFDSKGRVRNWWTDADLAHFHAATERLAAQYDTYKPFPDISVNGKQTLGENIADVAGLAASYDGYRASLGGKMAPAQDGFSGDQEFFIAYGQNWATKMREAAIRQRVLTDPHAPAEYRADTVRNLDSWYAAFGVQPGQKLYLGPSERVQVW
jgi:putative endopeptidase